MTSNRKVIKRKTQKIMFGPYPHIGHESSWKLEVSESCSGFVSPTVDPLIYMIHGSPSSNHRGGAVVQGTTYGVWCFIYSNPVQIAVEGIGEWSTRIKNHPISPFPKHGWPWLMPRAQPWRPWHTTSTKLAPARYPKLHHGYGSKPKKGW